MPTPFKCSVRLPIRRDHLWKIRSSETFMGYLVANGALCRMETSPAVRDEGSDSPTMVTRTQTYVPAEIVIPEMVKPLVDDSYVEITDVQTYDTSIPYVQHSVIHPTILGELVSTTATLTMLPSDSDEQAHECVHTLTGEVSVSLPLLGYYVEQAIVSNMQSFYTEYHTFVQSFIDMLLKTYGDGTLDSMDRAVENMLVQEAKQKPTH